MRKQGIGKAALARRLHCHLPQFDGCWILSTGHGRIKENRPSKNAWKWRSWMPHGDGEIVMDAATHNVSIEIGARVDAAGSLATPAEVIRAPEKLG